MSDFVWERWSATQVAKASHWLSQNNGIHLSARLLDFIATIEKPSVGDRAMSLLQYLARLSPDPGTNFFYNVWELDKVIEQTRGRKEVFEKDKDFLTKCADVLPLLAHSASEGQSDLIFIIFEYLLGHKGILAKGKRDGSFTITPHGWDVLAQARTAIQMTDQAFVAMWFDPSMHPVWTAAIHPAIQAASFKPVRIDKQEHNNRIDDEIVAEIRKSRFIVADFTGQRGGVYFEAGLATGMGRPVIWLCRDDELKNVHFDTRQYNFIIWRPEALTDLARALENRILATIGRGNHTATR